MGNGLLWLRSSASLALDSEGATQAPESRIIEWPVHHGASQMWVPIEVTLP